MTVSVNALLVQRELFMVALVLAGLDTQHSPAVLAVTGTSKSTLIPNVATNPFIYKNYSARSTQWRVVAWQVAEQNAVADRFYRDCAETIV